MNKSSRPNGVKPKSSDDTIDIAVIIPVPTKVLAFKNTAATI